MTSWTPRRLTLLRKLWLTSTPTSLIAREISALPGKAITKNAVIGKARRLELGEKPSAASHPSQAEWRSENTRRAWELRH